MNLHPLQSSLGAPWARKWRASSISISASDGAAFGFLFSARLSSPDRGGGADFPRWEIPADLGDYGRRARRGAVAICRGDVAIGRAAPQIGIPQWLRIRDIRQWCGGRA